MVAAKRVPHPPLSQEVTVMCSKIATVAALIGVAFLAGIYFRAIAFDIRVCLVCVRIALFTSTL